MRKKIVFIDHEPLTIRRQSIFCLESLVDRGFNIEFWDCSSYFHPKMRLPDSIEAPYLKHFYTLSQIEDSINQIDRDQTIFVIEVFNLFQTRHFFRMIGSKGIYTIKIEFYSTATVGTMGMWTKIRRANLNTLIRSATNFCKRVLYTNYKKWHKIPDWNFRIGSGTDSNIQQHINHPDWEQARACRTGERIVQNKYIVFLDEYFPLHPDMQFFVKDYKADPVKYYQTMIQYFDFIEQTTGLKIIISAHPKSEYGPLSFGHRQTIKYHTAELVRDAEAVLLHASSAIAFAVIFDKPISMIVTDGYVQTFSQYNYMTEVANMLHLPICNIDTNPFPALESLKVDESIRKAYIHRYLTSDQTQTMTNVDILCSTFEKL